MSVGALAFPLQLDGYHRGTAAEEALHGYY
jgi:hypothetical protein